jgi:hypothetical protein
VDDVSLKQRDASVGVGGHSAAVGACSALAVGAAGGGGSGRDADCNALSQQKRSELLQTKI